MSWKITAAVQWPDGKIYFFLEGGAYGRFVRLDAGTLRMDPGHPAIIRDHWPGLWKGAPDAVMASPHPGAMKTAYFFKDDEFIEVDTDTKKALPGYPKPIKNHWPGLWDADIDAITYLGNAGFYFFKKGQYAVVGPDRVVASGYPKRLADWDKMWAADLDAATFRWQASGHGQDQAFFFKGAQCIVMNVQDSTLSKRLKIRDFFSDLLPLASAQTFFEPHAHSFGFVNDFVIDARLFGQARWKMGFCGGMVHGALDRVRHLHAFPPNTQPPSEKCPDLQLFWELLKRQAATLFPLTWMKILLLQQTDDDNLVVPLPPDGTTTQAIEGLTYQTQADFWPKVRARLDKGEPAILCLIRQPKDGDPTQNHQVLAVGYDLMSEDHVRVNVYDPNHPGKVQVISFDPRPGHRLKGRQTDNSPLRCLFMIEEPPSLYER